MQKPFQFIIAFLLLFVYSCRYQKEETLTVEGLNVQVEILRDSWGINHIYAQNQHDLFFVQGYCAARDRLFQFEIWRRQATGTVAEILGPRELKRDIGARLFKFRGDMKTEMNHYHPEGEQIITSFVDGINAYIREVNKNPGMLPAEFKLLNIQPMLWNPEVVISRHQGLLGNITQELDIGRAVTKVGAEKVKELLWFHPREPIISLDPVINGDLLFENILELYNAFREDIQFEPSNIAEAFRGQNEKHQLSNSLINPAEHHLIDLDLLMAGSNNWVIRGSLMENGSAIMANDPHRKIAVPSLRYIAHLVAPGWNVIGGGEPEIPGISIGHNEHGAWGLTIFNTDGEDMYVYELNPANINQYRYQDHWEEMTLINETFHVKDSDDVKIALRYTRHGPVTFIDSANHKAYAIRCAWLEPGGSPYLASLRVDQAKIWEEFREACSYNHIPGENMVWADKDNNIGWQAVGIAPIRRNFSGLVPVPGDGRYEWDGYLPIREKPHVFNPESGYFATANQDVIPAEYVHWNAIGFTWADPFRGDRINEVLGSKGKMNMEDMKALQTDYFSIPARMIVPLLHQLSFDSDKMNESKERLLKWDYRLEKNSVAAAIYVAWENKIAENANKLFIPEEIRAFISLQLTKVIHWIIQPGEKFGSDPVRGRNEFLKEAFQQAITNLINELGGNTENWQYGQEHYKHVYIEHPLSKAVNKEWKDKLNAGPALRGGNSYTPGSTGGNNNQTSGASFRIIADTGDWDRSEATNTPGQSGDPESEFYKNLFKMWADDKYFPLYYSRDKIETILVNKLVLKPECK